MGVSALLLLADSRLPAGGHAHSGGLEEAVEAGRVTSVADLAAFLHGRLATAGLLTASFAAASCRPTPDLALLDAEYDARTPSPALRKASRAQGRALLRAGRAMWALPPLRDAHHAVALGVVAHGAGLTPADAALVAAYGSVTGPAGAAVRLLGLDPYAVQAVLAALAGDCDATAARATGLATTAGPDTGTGRCTLPATTAPLLDLGAERHARWEVRLFAS